MSRQSRSVKDDVPGSLVSTGGHPAPAYIDHLLLTLRILNFSVANFSDYTRSLRRGIIRIVGRNGSSVGHGGGGEA